MDVFKFRETLTKQLSKDGYDYNWRSDAVNNVYVSEGSYSFGYSDFSMPTYIYYHTHNKTIYAGYIFTVTSNMVSPEDEDAFINAANMFANEFNTNYSFGGAITALVIDGVIFFRSIVYSLDYANMPSSLLRGFKGTYSPVINGFENFYSRMKGVIGDIIELADKYFNQFFE